VTRPTPLPPGDAAVPALSRFLDLDLVAERVAACLMPGSSVRLVRTERLVYRPGVGCQAMWAVNVDGERRLVVASSPGRLASDTAKSRRHIAFDTVLGATVQWYPTDPALPALADSDEAWRGWLAGNQIPCGADPVELLSYRPGERAVLALGPVILKLYADDASLRAARGGATWAHGTLGDIAPEPMTVEPIRRVCIQARIAGRQLDHHDVVSAAGDAGAILRTLHGSTTTGASTHGPGAELEATAEAAGLIEAILPQVAMRVRRVVQRLSRDLPAGRPGVPSHGDFNVSQMIRRADGGVRVLDFDEHCLASPAYDLAAYVANAVSGRPGDLARARDARDALVEAYGTRPSDLDWYLAAAVLRRAPSPFRLQKRTWPARVAAIVGAAEAVLEA
jgi:hypothetical protein